MLVFFATWLGRIAPWYWMATSLAASWTLAKAWKLFNLNERQYGKDPFGDKSKYIVQLLTWLSCGMILVGAIGIITWIKYPFLRAARYQELPLDLQIQNILVLVVLLAVPTVALLIGITKHEIARALVMAREESQQRSKRSSTRSRKKEL